MKSRHSKLRLAMLLVLLSLAVNTAGCTAPRPSQPPESTAAASTTLPPRQEAARQEQHARADAGYAKGYYAGSIYDSKGHRLCWTSLDANGTPYRAYDPSYEVAISTTFDNAVGGLRKQWGSILTKRNRTPCGFEDDTGQSIQTYLDADLMLKLYNVMEEKGIEGAVCVMKVSDNTIEALVGSNGYSPTSLQLDETYTLPAGTVSRALQNLPPGSTMKMLSAPIADIHGITALTDSDEWNGIHNSDHWSGARYSKDISLYLAVVKSSNVFFAKVYSMVGKETVMEDLASYFALSDEGVGSDFGYLIGPGCLNIADGNEDNFLRCAFGQGKVRLNLPYLSAVCAQVCTDGKLEAPRTIKAVIDTNDHSVIEEGTPQQELASIPPEAAETTREAMHEVASRLKMDAFPQNYEILAKTGTATYSAGEAHYIISCVYPAEGTPEDGWIVSLRVDNSTHDFANQDADIYEAVLREIIPFT